MDKENTFLTFSLYIYTINGSSSIFPIKGKHKSAKSQYKKIHRRFVKKICSPGTEENFWKLMKDYRGNGFYIPVTHDNKLDKKTLKRYLSEINKKKWWIIDQIKHVQKIKTFRRYKYEISKIEKKLNLLLKYKEQYNDSKSKQEQVQIKKKSQELFEIFKQTLLRFIEKISFYQSYKYPLDHFELRRKYDLVKKKEDLKSKKMANEIYFYRKIVQDGAQDKNHGRSDRFLRSGLDTIHINLKKEGAIISENMRFDIAHSLKNIRRELNKGKKRLIERLREWRERTKRKHRFYIALSRGKVKVNNHYETGEEIIESKSKTRFNLKSYNMNKQKEVYNFWKSQDPLMQAIFSIETILFNEVGAYDRGTKSERKDVSQVVINRSILPKYNTIYDNDGIFPYLNRKSHEDKISQNPWLNLLFKEGEFSFSYYFIDGSVRIYCPDQTRRGTSLRLENIEIALGHLERPDYDFTGVRYFSRASMLGKVDMSPIWKDYSAIAERPGIPVKSSSNLLKTYKKGHYEYIYHFKDSAGQDFKVIKIKRNTYSFNLESKKFYRHRSPHYFLYFRPKQ